jgi:carbamoyl-phosphate synthase large subunit
MEDGLKEAAHLGYPLIVRPSYVLGGRGMSVVSNVDELKRSLSSAFIVSKNSPILLDHFLEGAVELDVDAVSDGKEVFIGGILEHIELAGIHSGDSACCIPSFSISNTLLDKIREQVKILAKSLSIIGPINVQFAIQKGVIFILEVNPRVSRTVPLVSKAIGISLAQVGVRCMLGKSLKEQGILGRYEPAYFCVKQPVFSFDKLPGSERKLGTEMKSTGEVMGIALTFEEAFSKSLHAIKKNPAYKFSINNITDLKSMHSMVCSF